MKQLLVLLSFLPFLALSQGVYNNGSSIVVNSGTYFIINGSYTNDNGGTVDLDGTIKVSGDFVNQATNNVFTNVDGTGNVVFDGSDQTVSSPVANYINFENVSVNDGSNTVISAGSGLTVNGTLTVDGTLTLETPSDETIGVSMITGTGSSDIAGSGTINVKRFFKVGGRWQYVGVPMVGQPSTIFTESTGTYNHSLFYYDESFDAATDPTNTNYENWTSDVYKFDDAWTLVQPTEGTAVTLQPAAGYVFRASQDFTATFTGAPADLNHDASYSPSITYNFNDANDGYYDGWNLISNPYTAALDWDAITRSNVSNTVYMWDGDNGNYVYYNNGSPDDNTPGEGETLNADANARYIPPMQSFFIKATGSSPSITIPASARVHYSATMYKKNYKKPDYDFVKLSLNSGKKYDEVLIRFFNNPRVKEGYDYYSDAEKLFSTTSGLPQIYSLSPDNIALAINTQPMPNDDEKIVPLGIYVQKSGNYDFNLKEINLQDFDDAYLVDKKNNNIVYIDLNNYNHYNTFIEKGTTEGRFYIVFKKAVSLENEINRFSDLNLYVFNRQLIITSSKNYDANIEIINSLGQKVLDFKYTGGKEIKSLINLPLGAYVCRFMDRDLHKTVKFILK